MGVPYMGVGWLAIKKEAPAQLPGFFPEPAVPFEPQPAGPAPLVAPYDAPSCDVFAPRARTSDRRHTAPEEKLVAKIVPNENPYRSPSKRPLISNGLKRKRPWFYMRDLFHQQFAGTIIFKWSRNFQMKNYKMNPFCPSLWVMGLLQMAENKWCTGILTPITWSCNPICIAGRGPVFRINRTFVVKLGEL